MILWLYRESFLANISVQGFFSDWNDDFILYARYLTWLNMPLHIIHQSTETWLILAHTRRRRNETIFSLLDKMKARWLQTVFFALEVCDDNLWTPDNPLLGNLEKKISSRLFNCPCITAFLPIPTKKKLPVFLGLALLKPNIFRTISGLLVRLTPEGERQCQKAQGVVVWVLCQERFGWHSEAFSLLSRWFIVRNILHVRKLKVDKAPGFSQLKNIDPFCETPVSRRMKNGDTRSSVQLSSLWCRPWRAPCRRLISLEDRNADGLQPGNSHMPPW